MGFEGSIDYFDLFEPDAPWTATAQTVRVFKVYASWVQNFATPDQLRHVVAGVAARSMALALEIGALPATAECGMGIEGFDATVETIEKIHAAGGRVDLVAFDEPLAFGKYDAGAAACQWPLERVAREAATFAAELRRVEPGVVIGDIEPLWSTYTATEIGQWLDAYRTAAGEPLAFLHLDADWNRPDWPAALVAMDRATRARGIAAGIIYNGSDASSDAAWNDAAIHRAVDYEGLLGGQPDHVVFQSWMDHPDHVLPESDPTTFTGLIGRYMAPRTAISQPQVNTAAGRLTFTADLRAGAVPLAGAPLVVTAVPLSETYKVIEVSGRVPDEASSIVVGIRINTEGAAPGATDMRIYRITYEDGGATRNRVANAGFDAGLDHWAAYGSGSVTAPTSDRGDGRMLRLRATAAQNISVDAFGFAPTPGSRFRMTVAARLPSGRTSTGYVAAIFLGKTEIERQRLNLAAAPVAVATVTSAADGSIRLIGAPIEAGSYVLRVEYAGDATHWPALLEQPITVP
jgi:hypothetical protein